MRHPQTHTSEARRKMSEVNLKYTYTAIAPSGKIYKFNNLLGFCREFNAGEPNSSLHLKQANFHAVLTGKQKHHKGWTITRSPL